MQRNFEPMRKQVEARRGNELTDVTAKVLSTRHSWEASWKRPSISCGLSMIPTSSPSTRSSAPDDLEFVEMHSSWRSKNPVPQFKAIAKSGEFLETRLHHSF
jgi:hypothetical protein